VSKFLTPELIANSKVSEVYTGSLPSVSSSHIGAARSPPV